MIAIDINKVKLVQAFFSSEIEDQKKKALEKLNKLYFKTTNTADKRYLDGVILLFSDKENVLLWEPEKIDLEKRKFIDVPTYVKTYKNGKTKKIKSDIKNKILIALGYFGSFCATRFGVIVPGISV